MFTVALQTIVYGFMHTIVDSRLSKNKLRHVIHTQISCSLHEVFSHISSYTPILQIRQEACSVSFAWALIVHLFEAVVAKWLTQQQNTKQ